MGSSSMGRTSFARSRSRSCPHVNGACIAVPRTGCAQLPRLAPGVPSTLTETVEVGEVRQLPPHAENQRVGRRVAGEGIAMTNSSTTTNGPTTHDQSADARPLESAKASMMLDHARLAESLGRLVDFVKASDHPLAREEWDAFEDAILRHMDAEEVYLLPAFGNRHAGEAAAIRNEHDAIRRQVGEIGVAFDLHTLRAERIEGLERLLHTHAEREAREFYRWADREENRGRLKITLDHLGEKVFGRSPSRATSTLLGLIETCGDGERGYRRAAAAVADEGLRLMFQRCAGERADFAKALSGLLSAGELGAARMAETTVLGAMHRGWIEASATLTQGRSRLVLRECLRGEDAALKNYRAALRVGLSPMMQETVQAQYEAIKRVREDVRALLSTDQHSGRREQVLPSA